MTIMAPNLTDGQAADRHEPDGWGAANAQYQGLLGLEVEKRPKSREKTLQRAFHIMPAIRLSNATRWR